MAVCVCVQLKCESKMSVFFFFLIQCSFNCIFILFCNLSSNLDEQEPVSYGVAAVSFLNTLSLSIIAFDVWFQRLMLVQTVEAFWINNSCLALHRLQLFVHLGEWRWLFTTLCLEFLPLSLTFVYPLSWTSWYNLKTFISF